MVNLPTSSELAPPDMPAEYLNPIGARSIATAGWPSPGVTPLLEPPPDLPGELLSPGSEPLGVERASIESPDLPGPLLERAVILTNGMTRVPEPDFPAAILQPTTEGPGGGAPPGPDLPPGELAPLSIVSGIDAVPGPDDAMPLSSDHVSIVDETTFEQRWDELSRRLQSSEPGGILSDPRDDGPVDLPPEHQRPAAESDESESSASDDEEV